MLKIVTAPNKVLASPTEPISHITTRIRKLIKHMERTLISQKNPEGVGLAAPQVGESIRLFILKIAPDKPTKVFINPEILPTTETGAVKERSGKTAPVNAGKKKTHAKMEGCLSVPRIWAPLKRAQQILVRYKNEKGEEKEEWFNGFDAVIVQHEVDHLNGILFTQRCLEQNVTLYEEVGDELQPMKT